MRRQESQGRVCFQLFTLWAAKIRMLPKVVSDANEVKTVLICRLSNLPQQRAKVIDCATGGIRKAKVIDIDAKFHICFLLSMLPYEQMLVMQAFWRPNVKVL